MLKVPSSFLFLERVAKGSQENRLIIFNTYAECERRLFLMKIYLEEFTNQRSQKVLWHHAHHSELAKSNKEEHLLKEYYNQSLKSSDRAIDVRLKFGTTLSDYYAVVTKFNILTNNSIDSSKINALLSNLDFTDATVIDKGLSSDEVRSSYHQSKIELTKEYLQQIETLNTINNEIQLVSIKFI